MSKKFIYRRKYRYYRNLRISELVHLCKSFDECIECPLKKYCPFDFETDHEKYFNRMITIKYRYERKVKPKE